MRPILRGAKRVYGALKQGPGAHLGIFIPGAQLRVEGSVFMKFLRLRVILGIAVPLLAALPISSIQAQTTELLGAHLYGKEQKGGGEAPKGSGEWNADVDPKTGRICYYLDVARIGEVAAAHIHRADAAETAPPEVVLPFSPEGDERCVTVSQSLVEALLAKPKDFIVDVHSADYPTAAIRGEIAH